VRAMSMPPTPMQMATTRRSRTRRRKQAQYSTQIKSPVERPGFLFANELSIRRPREGGDP
jgi:hypothetical protein